MDSEARLLYFISGPMPTVDQNVDAKRQRSRGFRVDFRNAVYAKVDGDLEPADAIAGEAAPQRYRDAYPWADDYDPEDAPAVGAEFIGDDGHAYVRAVRGDGIAYNMRLSLAAPAAIGSGAPVHGPFAGVDHAARIRAEQAERDAAGDEGDEGDEEGQDGDDEGAGEGTGSDGGSEGGEGTGEGQNGATGQDGQGTGQPQPLANRKARRKVAAGGKAPPVWNRNA